MDIRYGENFFEGPAPLEERSPPSQAGLFAVLAGKLSSDLPWVICFGQSRNLARLPLDIHVRRSCWLRQATTERNLYFAYHVLPDSTLAQRKHHLPSS